jgi:hypothetical protein
MLTTKPQLCSEQAGPRFRPSMVLPRSALDLVVVVQEPAQRGRSCTGGATGTVK